MKIILLILAGVTLNVALGENVETKPSPDPAETPESDPTPTPESTPTPEPTLTPGGPTIEQI